MDAPYARLEQLEPGVARVLAHNPSAFTYYGTQTYLLGEREVAVVDPGPDLDEHVEALIAAIGGRNVAAICCTHTHRDHSPAARRLAAATGGPVIGCAPLALETVGPRADAAFDGDYTADRVLADGESIDIDGRTLTAVTTPGHTSNHLCFAYCDVLRARLATIPGIADLEIEKQVLAPQINVRIDYAAAARYGVPAPQVLSTLQSLVEGEKITQIVEGGRRFALVVRLPEAARSANGLGGILIETPSGSVPLR